jgi:ribonuclease HI
MATDKEVVSELIDQGTHKWNEPLIRDLFFKPDVDRILQIPLRHINGEDSVAWALEPKGIYSVRSAYRGLVAEKEQREELQGGGATTSAVGDESKWKKLWKLDVQPRVRVFWWRVLKGILPDYATLARRHVKEQSTCPVCLSTSETLLHALVECSHAQQFWSAAKDVFNLKLPRLHPITWAADILCEDSFENLDREMTISIMAQIWDSRNKWSHDDQGYNPKITVGLVAETLALVQGLKKKKRNRRREVSTWLGPPDGVVKLNSDGAIRQGEGIAATGGVARDRDGFRSAWCRVYHGIKDPLIIEALAMRDALVEALKQNFDKVVAETDCSELVQLWVERSNSRAVISPIISEIGELCANFTSFELVQVRRTANSVAHECARFACAHGVPADWMDESPSFLSYSLLADCNSDYPVNIPPG